VTLLAMHGCRKGTLRRRRSGSSQGSS
jgi:hypothetical protein